MGHFIYFCSILGRLLTYIHGHDVHLSIDFLEIIVYQYVDSILTLITYIQRNDVIFKPADL